MQLTGDSCVVCGEPATGTTGDMSGNWASGVRQLPVCDEHNPFANLVMLKADELEGLRAENARLVVLLSRVRTHMEDIAEAYRSGALTTHDTTGGARSNRNMDLLVELRQSLTPEPSEQPTEAP